MPRGTTRGVDRSTSTDRLLHAGLGHAHFQPASAASCCRARRGSTSTSQLCPTSTRTSEPGCSSTRRRRRIPPAVGCSFCHGDELNQRAFGTSSGLTRSEQVVNTLNVWPSARRCSGSALRHDLVHVPLEANLASTSSIGSSRCAQVWPQSSLCQITSWPGWRSATLSSSRHRRRRSLAPRRFDAVRASQLEHRDRQFLDRVRLVADPQFLHLLRGDAAGAAPAGPSTSCQSLHGSSSCCRS